MFKFQRFALCMATLLLVGFLGPTFAQSQRDKREDKRGDKKKESSAADRKAVKIAAFSSQIESIEITAKAGGKTDAVFLVRPGIKVSAETRRRVTEPKGREAPPSRVKAQI